MAVKYVNWLDQGGPGRRLCLNLVMFIAFVILTALVVLGVGRVYYLEGERSNEAQASYNLTDLNFNISDTEDFNPADLNATALLENFHNTFLITVKVIDVDPLKYTAMVSNYLVRTNFSSIPNATLNLGDPIVTPINNDTAYLDKKTSMSFTSGDVNRYPFDTYRLVLPYSVEGIPSNLTNLTNITLSIFAFGALQNWRFNMSFSEDSNAVWLLVDIKRSPTTRGFSLFVAILMWLITLTVICITFQTLIRSREITPPLIGSFIALLFALPAIRNVQPNIPPIGALIDVVGLFFNMFFVSLCLIVLMTCYVVRIKVPPPPTTPLGASTDYTLMQPSPPTHPPPRFPPPSSPLAPPVYQGRETTPRLEHTPRNSPPITGPHSRAQSPLYQAILNLDDSTRPTELVMQQPETPRTSAQVHTVDEQGNIN